MPVDGYMLIEGEKWLVTIEQLKTNLSLTRRSDGEDGIYLEDVQSNLEHAVNRWLIDPLRYGVTVYLPMHSTDARSPVPDTDKLPPPNDEPPAANGG